MDKYNSYIELLTKSYDEAVKFLLQKYGPAQDDYYRENSYQRFMRGEIKNITKGKASRVYEGIYCHHIDENQWLNISDKNYIKRNKIPFESQRKDRLVYCDLIEHSILHVLIAKETNFKFGSPGYSTYLRWIIEEWYLDDKIPRPEWMKRCRDKSLLNAQEAFDILQKMQKEIGESYFNTLFDYYEAIIKEEGERKKRAQRSKENEIAEREYWIEYSKKLHAKSLRRDIVAASYFVCIKYKNSIEASRTSNIIPFEEYVSKMKKDTKEKILANLVMYVGNLREIAHK